MNYQNKPLLSAPVFLMVALPPPPPPPALTDRRRGQDPVVGILDPYSIKNLSVFHIYKKKVVHNVSQTKYPPARVHNMLRIHTHLTLKFPFQWCWRLLGDPGLDHGI